MVEESNPGQMKENRPQNYARTRLQKQNAHLQAIKELEESASNNDSEEVIIDSNLSIAAELAEAIASNTVTDDHQEEEEHLPTEASTEPAASTDDSQDEESEQQDQPTTTENLTQANETCERGDSENTSITMATGLNLPKFTGAESPVIWIAKLEAWQAFHNYNDARTMSMLPCVLDGALALGSRHYNHHVHP